MKQVPAWTLAAIVLASWARTSIQADARLLQYDEPAQPIVQVQENYQAGWFAGPGSPFWVFKGKNDCPRSSFQDSDPQRMVS